MPLSTWPQAFQRSRNRSSPGAACLRHAGQLGRHPAGAASRNSKRQAQVQHQQIEARASRMPSHSVFGGDQAGDSGGQTEMRRGTRMLAIDSANSWPRDAETNPVLSISGFQRSFSDAAQYRGLRRRRRPFRKALPTVQRPGITRDVPRTGDNSSKIQNLQRQLVGAHGERAARLAGQIRSLKRSAMMSE